MAVDFENDIEKILIMPDELKTLAENLGRRISEDYRDDGELLVVCILKGSLLFTAELLKNITIPVKLDTMCVSSYGAGTVSSGNINIKKDLDTKQIKGMNVLLVEDIVDSGNTIKRTKELLMERGPKSVRVCSMLDKPERRQVQMNPEYVGKKIPDVFVVGYGLDFDENYRNLPYVGVLKPEVYQLV